MSIKAKLAEAAERYEKRQKEQPSSDLQLGKRPKELKGKQVTAIFDGEILCFHVVTSLMVEELDRSTGCYSWQVDFRAAKRSMQERIEGIADWLGARRIYVAFGAPPYFRRKVFKGYKANRTGKRPLAYNALKDWVLEQKAWHPTQWQGLEADDVMGVLGTTPSHGTTVLISDDKDMLTVPAFHLRLKMAKDEAFRGLFQIRREEAEMYHLRQTLTGDLGDGYDGIPGIGVKRAEKILGDALGVRAWRIIVSEYEKAGMDANAAVITARLAKILQYPMYNPVDGSIKLWTPPKK